MKTSFQLLVHVQDMGTHISSNHILKFLNNSIDSNLDNRRLLNDSP